MSASSKKKLRSEQAAEKLTEKQQTERKQAKEVKIYTVAFTVVMIVVLVTAIVVAGFKIAQNSGIRERSTVAYTVGENEISNAEFNYFFVDAVNTFMSQNGQFATMMGLNPSIPLDQQYLDQEQTMTWADNFLDTARSSAKSVYALADAAKAEGYTLTEEDQTMIDNVMAQNELYAAYSGAGSVKAYLKAMYGAGASEKSYREYIELSVLADSYRVHYAESLKFEDSDLREAEKTHYNAYSSFTYHQYYQDVSKFITGGTTDDSGVTTYTQEEKQAAAKAAEEALQPLTEVKSVEELDKAIAAMEINEGTSIASLAFTHNDFRNISPSTAQWLSDAARKPGDVTIITNTTDSTNEAGETVTDVTGYTVVYFESADENTSLLPNVRHILVNYEGGTTDEATGSTVYSDEEKAAAMEKAQALLKTFTEGEATEEAFAALATENTGDPGSRENGGLYENVYPGQMVPTFNDWCFDAARKPGDTGIVESNYGVHVMYYCGEGTLSYRDLQLTSELTQKAMDAWMTSLLESAETQEGDTSLVNTGIILNRG